MIIEDEISCPYCLQREKLVFDPKQEEEIRCKYCNSNYLIESKVNIQTKKKTPIINSVKDENDKLKVSSFR